MKCMLTFGLGGINDAKCQPPSDSLYAVDEPSNKIEQTMQETDGRMIELGLTDRAELGCCS